jgi:hypothetical protein
MRWGTIIRDIIIIWILTALAGFVVGVTGAKGQQFILGIAFANLIFGTVGFCISGCLAKSNRWKHLNLVALGVWLVGLINVIVMPITIVSWFFGIIFIYTMMGIGGGLSYIFVKTPKTIESSVKQTQPNENKPISEEEAG